VEKYIYSAQVIDVYDGDTFKAIVDLGFGIKTKETFRLFGVNAPEIKGESREAGIKTRDFVRSKILNKAVTIRTIKDSKEKYGRYLARVYYEDDRVVALHLNDQLVSLGLAERKEYR